MTCLRDSESAPEFTKTSTHDSDANDLEGSNPSAPDYIGNTPITRFENFNSGDLTNPCPAGQ